jgi:Holliday junction resolvasome RuvABC endonuclease subunit
LLHRAEPVVAAVNSVRRQVFGRGNLKKKAIWPLVRQRVPQVADHDQADAWALARYEWERAHGVPAAHCAGAPVVRRRTKKVKEA